MPLTHALDLVTIVVPALDDALGHYHDGLALQPAAEGRCPQALALALGRADLIGARYVGLAAHGRMRLRLLEASAAESAVSPRRPGWLAVALEVGDVDASHARAIGAGFAGLATPTAPANGPLSRIAVVGGPAGESIRLCQRPPQPSSARHAATSLPDWLMGVIGSRQIERARGYYEGLLGATSRLDGSDPCMPAAALIEHAGQPLVRIEAQPNGDQLRSSGAGCGLLSVRLARQTGTDAAESQLIQACRVLAGPEGELIELL